MTTITIHVDGQPLNIKSTGSFGQVKKIADDINAALQAAGHTCRLRADPFNAPPNTLASLHWIANQSTSIAIYRRHNNEVDDLNGIIDASSGTFIDFSNAENCVYGDAEVPESFNATGNISNQTEQPVAIATDGTEMLSTLSLVIDKTLYGDSRRPAAYGAITPQVPMVIALTIANGVIAWSPFDDFTPVHKGDTSGDLHSSVGGVTVVASDNSSLIFTTENSKKYYFAAHKDDYWTVGNIQITAKRLNPYEVSDKLTFTDAEGFENFNIGELFGTVLDYETLESKGYASYIVFNPTGEKRYLMLVVENIKSEIKGMIFDGDVPGFSEPLENIQYHDDGNYRFLIPSGKSAFLFPEKNNQSQPAQVLIYKYDPLNYYVKTFDHGVVFINAPYRFGTNAQVEYLYQAPKWGEDLYYFDVFELTIANQLRFVREDNINYDNYVVRIFDYAQVYDYLDGVSSTKPTSILELSVGLDTDFTMDEILPVGRYVLETSSPNPITGSIYTTIHLTGINTISQDYDDSLSKKVTVSAKLTAVTIL